MRSQGPQNHNQKPPLKSILSIKDLSVRYGSETALDSLCVDIMPREIVGIIGPNGAGKTSFIKALCGRLKSEGDIIIAGKPIKKGQSRQKYIGLVPQDIGLYGHMTAKENLHIFARIMRIKSSVTEKRITAALKAVGMSDKADARVETLSGGMKRRINVAAAIMHQPKILILDEPTAGVDVPARDTIHKLARLLANTGMGVLLITHELEQAEAFCNKILVLAKGRKLAFASPTNLLAECFGHNREVTVRFSTPPSPELISAVTPFKFTMGDLPTIWKTMTSASEVSFVSAFMAAVKNGDRHIREISVGRPGLSSLMYHLEKNDELPHVKLQSKAS